jgi:hypothetical protein
VKHSLPKVVGVEEPSNFVGEDEVIRRQMRRLRLVFRRCFGVLNEGQAIAVAKNVKVRQNEMSTPGALPRLRLLARLLCGFYTRPWIWLWS